MTEGTLAGNYKDGIVNKNVRQTLNVNFLDKNLFNKVNTAIKIANTQYFNYDVESIDGLRFLKYGIGGTYKTMEDRVSDLESRLQKQEQVLRVEIELQKMRQEQIIDELKSKAKVDSMRFAAEMVQQEYLIKLQSME